MFSIAIKYFLLFSDFEQLPHNVPVTATIADIEEKKGFIVYYVSGIKPVDECGVNSPVTRTLRFWLQRQPKWISCNKGSSLMHQVFYSIFSFYFYFILSTFSRKVSILIFAFLLPVPCTDRYNLLILSFWNSLYLSLQLLVGICSSSALLQSVNFPQAGFQH